MDTTYSDFILTPNMLLEIERQEEIERNRKILQKNEKNKKEKEQVIQSSQELLSNSPAVQHKSVSERFTQRKKQQSTIIKSRSKSDNENKKRREDGVSSLSKLINKELEDIDFDEWENSIEKFISPANVTGKRRKVKSPQVSSLAIDNEIINHANEDQLIHDNVTFIEPQQDNHEDFKQASQFIESRLKTNIVSQKLDENQSVIAASFTKNHSQNFVNQSLLLDTTKDLSFISNWGLPVSTVNEYSRKGIDKLFQWQTECLTNPKVLFEGANLIYSAPTSGGKTLVSEVLMIKNILERKKKAIFILPFVSIVREKINYLQDLLSSSGVKVDGFYGGYHPARGFDPLNLSVCTIEKANSIINRLIEENKLDELGMIVIDEIHLISDPQRGYILELLLTKVLFICQKFEYKIQLIGMSATLSNVDLLCKWLHAEYYNTDFRPVDLHEMIKIGKNIFDKNLKLIRQLLMSSEWSSFFPHENSDDIYDLVMETISENYQLIIFCPSKDRCESLCKNISLGIAQIRRKCPERIEHVLHPDRMQALIAQGKALVTGIDSNLQPVLWNACAFHHAGLTTDERDLIEMGFKNGIIKVLVATSTLSAGVNLPSRRVIIRTPLFNRSMMSNIQYRQMIGRAGRKGKDTLGESILICDNQTQNIGKQLINSTLNPIASCLHVDDYAHLKRALMEIIASNMANTRSELEDFVNHTFYCLGNTISFNYLKETSDDDLKAFVESKSQKNVNDLLINEKKKKNDNDPIRNTMNFLLNYDFIRLHKDDDSEEIKFVPTRLSVACLSSAMPPKDGFMLLTELQKARQNFVLDSDLHAIYLVTPFSVTYQLSDMDWTLFVKLYDELPLHMKRVGKMVGVSDAFLLKAITGRQNSDWHVLQVHKRFYVALALQELVNEVPISSVAKKFSINRGLLQSLQQNASTFSAILTNFCEAMQWNLLVLILRQYRERLFFGIHPDLIDLMKIPSVTNTKVARALYTAKIRSLSDLANSKVISVEDILIDVFSSSNGKFFMSGKSLDVTPQEMAKLMISEAQEFLQCEIGIKVGKWNEGENQQEKEQNVEIDDSMKFKSPLNVKKPLEVTAVSETLNHSIEAREMRKRKGDSKMSKIESPLIQETPKRSKLSELSPCNDYRKKLRSSGGKIDLDNSNIKPEKMKKKLISVIPKKRSELSPNLIQEISYENKSLFNNHGISLDDEKIIQYELANEFGIEKFLKITNVLDNENEFENFVKELSNRKEISLSIGVNKIQSQAMTIGGKLLKSTQKVTEKFIFNRIFFISCISICCEGNKIFHLDLQHGKLIEQGKSQLRKLLSRDDITICIYDAKESLKILHSSGICSNFERLSLKDPRLASWIINPDIIPKWSELIENVLFEHKKLSNYITWHKNSTGSIGHAYKSTTTAKIRTAIEAFFTKELLDKSPIHKEKKLENVLRNLEMPIQKLLVQLEVAGFPVNSKKLHSLIENCVKHQKSLEEYIYRLHGRPFNLTNLASVAQAVGIEKSKEKKLSTNKNVLSKINTPLADAITLYRSLSKTISNIQPMTKLVRNERVHGSSFSLTQTGRISMSEPNLQNVTKDFIINFDDVNEVISFRSAFQCKAGKRLICADFCQLEFRILSHLCKDSTLLSIMQDTKKDIFIKIAAKWNKVSELKVTELLRNQTKTLCYGVIYGMGMKSLAEQMGVEENEAKKLIEEFHATYPGIRLYTEKVISKTRELGYTETITCRRRHLPSINSEDSSQSSKAERQALNSTIQGSASDLVKNAMIKMEKSLKKRKISEEDCRLVMHLHDELFYEVNDKNWKEIVKILINSMENCVPLRVPLKVKVKQGLSWGEMIEIN